MVARSLRFVIALALVTLVVAAASCGINPQPEPPGVVGDKTGGGDGRGPDFNDDEGENGEPDASPGVGEAGADHPDGASDAGLDADSGDASEDDLDAGDGGDAEDGGAGEDAGDDAEPETGD